MFPQRPTQDCSRTHMCRSSWSIRSSSWVYLFLLAALLTTLVAFFLGAKSGVWRILTSQKKRKKKRSAIEFSYNRQAHVQIFTSHFECLFLSFLPHSLFGEVGASTEALCLAWVLCSSTSVGGDPADPARLLIWGVSRPSCAVIVTEDSSIIVLGQQRGNQLRSSAACGSVGGFHLGRHNSRHVFVLFTAPDFSFNDRKTLEKSLFRCSNLPASLLLTFCFELFWQSTETRSITVSRKPDFLTLIDLFSRRVRISVFLFSFFLIQLHSKDVFLLLALSSH